MGPFGSSLPISTLGSPKKGCRTCRSKKVKCDKEYPVCFKCSRRKLICEWAFGEPSLRERRRGKLRDSKRVPRPILPARSLQMQTQNEESSSGMKRNSNICLLLNHSGDSVSEITDGGLEDLTNKDDEFMWPLCTDDMNISTLSISQAMCASNCLDLENDFLVNNATESHRSSNTSIPLDYLLSDHHIALPNSMVLNDNEHRALAHYQTVFSRYRATKDPQWSTHRILLNLGSQNSMILHFILAVSMNDSVTRERQDSTCEDAQQHFEAGSQLLIETMKNEDANNHLSLMTAFFFLYLYMLSRNNVAPQRLRQLSRTVLDFVKKYELDSQCVGTRNNPSSIPDRNRGLFARLIIWIYTEDLKCGFQGCGGYFAGYLAQDADNANQIYDASKSALESHFGGDYPCSQLEDDLTNSAVLEFLYSMSRLHQLINDLSEEPISNLTHTQNCIEKLFITLEQRYSSIFRYSKTSPNPCSRMLINADFDVVLFNALRIYYFRSTVTDLDMETPLEIQSAIKTVVSIIERTFTSGRTEYHDRLQWPLFLAGIETDDRIHRKWILTTITSNRILRAMQRTLEAQNSLGERLTMPNIRQMFYECNDLVLGVDPIASLDAIRSTCLV